MFELQQVESSTNTSSVVVDCYIRIFSIYTVAVWFVTRQNHYCCVDTEEPSQLHSTTCNAPYHAYQPHIKPNKPFWSCTLCDFVPEVQLSGHCAGRCCGSLSYKSLELIRCEGNTVQSNVVVIWRYWTWEEIIRRQSGGVAPLEFPHGKQMLWTKLPSSCQYANQGDLSHQWTSLNLWAS